MTSAWSASTLLIEQKRSAVPPRRAHRQTTSESELEKRLEDNLRLIRKQSFLRRFLIHALSSLALVSIETARRLHNKIAHF
jgi:hypothetical protein